MLFRTIFDELYTIPDLTRVEAGFDEKSLRVQARKLLGG